MTYVLTIGDQDVSVEADTYGEALRKLGNPAARMAWFRYGRYCHVCRAKADVARKGYLTEGSIQCEKCWKDWFSEKSSEAAERMRKSSADEKERSILDRVAYLEANGYRCGRITS